MRVTLENLHTATAQQVFDQVCTHALEQQAQSLDEGGKLCVYRNADGLMCFAGCLIADEEYKEGMEENGWLDLISIFRVTDKNSKLIASLQDIHDNYPVEGWRQKLAELGNRYNLDITILEEGV